HLSFTGADDRLRVIHRIDAPYHDQRFGHATFDRRVRRHLDAERIVRRGDERMKPPVGPHVQRDIVDKRVDSRCDLCDQAWRQPARCEVLIRQTNTHHKARVIDRVANRRDDFE
ncbi:MAG: hypothetical protein ACK55I_39105, partial [bacterium]